MPHKPRARDARNRRTKDVYDVRDYNKPKWAEIKRRIARTSRRKAKYALGLELKKNPSFRKGDKITFPGDHGVRVAGRFLGMEDAYRGVAAVCEEDTYKLLKDSPESGEAYTAYVDLGDVRPRGKSGSKTVTKKASSPKVPGGIKHANGRYEVGGGKWFGTKAKAEAYLRKHG